LAAASPISPTSVPVASRVNPWTSRSCKTHSQGNASSRSHQAATRERGSARCMIRHCAKRGTQYTKHSGANSGYQPTCAFCSVRAKFPGVTPLARHTSTTRCAHSCRRAAQRAEQRTAAHMAHLERELLSRKAALGQDPGRQASWGRHAPGRQAGRKQQQPIPHFNHTPEVTWGLP
jgi:hypothetical protein